MSRNEFFDSASSDAVPSLNSCPREVTGRDCPVAVFVVRRAASSPSRPVIGLEVVPGRSKPVKGRPQLETGLKLCSDDDRDLDAGRFREVPGLKVGLRMICDDDKDRYLGIAATVFASNNRSAVP
mgnify:FL=1